MALVKPLKQQEPAGEPLEQATGRQVQRQAQAHRRKARTAAKQQQAAERISTATTQLSSGITEASSAVEELKQAMEQIASGAQQSSGAAQESLRAISESTRALVETRTYATTSKEKTLNLQTLIAEIGQNIKTTISSVELAAERQRGSVIQVKELEKQSANIGEIVKAVARIADQTNLLALNAAIEAASAGKYGKGFAVVADEVRNLAETSENSARAIDKLIAQIQQEVDVIAKGIDASAEIAKTEVEKGQGITTQLETVRTDMIDIGDGAKVILEATEKAEAAIKDAQQGAEGIAAAAEEQSSACDEAVRTIDEQTRALDQSEQAAQELSEMAEELKNSADIGKSAEEVASASEELSSAVEEINRAATQIMAAIEQIAKGAEQQSSAAQQSMGAIQWIEQASQTAEERSNVALERIQNMRQFLLQNQTDVEALITGINKTMEENKKSSEQIAALGRVTSKIDKTVESITTVSIQTSMLAVSGAIEAARAGEHGKGFVVVSTDISNLARDSAENAERIKDLVKAVQEQVTAVQHDIDEIVTVAVTEVEKTRAISANLVRINDDIDDVLQGNEGIAKNAKEVSKMLAEVKKGVDQISEASVETERATTEASAAARQQSQGAEELAAAIEEIASLADELQN